ncbi:MAG TPA: FAD-dependent oxidoreductase [Dissulfurispiraceae bacterium]|nr:FAD-dependent oxidoreductase [Dissulfurispiraceae bacterium]
MARHLVLVGAGHAHLMTLKNLREFTARGHRVTVVSADAYHYYSGMGPGMLSGIYRPQDIRFHVKKMVEDRGGLFVKDRVVRIDPGGRVLSLASGNEITYDVVSFNTGSDVPSNHISSSDERIVKVKPIINLLRARQSILDIGRTGSLHLVVAGGGAAGVEIAGNLQRLIHENGIAATITLVAGTGLLGKVPRKVREAAHRSLEKRGVEVIEGDRVLSLQDGAVILPGGRTLPLDMLFLALGVIPSALFRESGIPTGEDGGLLVNDFLESVAYPGLFGGGDCISLQSRPLNKVGVYAVRQNPVLLSNLLASLEGKPLSAFVPGGAYLLILNMGNGKGILWKKEWVLQGRIAFLLKDYIDRRFMKTYQVSGERDES